MSTLYDRMVRRLGPDQFDPGARAVFVVSDVVDYYYHREKSWWALDSLPNLAPPFDAFFLEARAPKSVMGSEGALVPWEKHDYSQCWGLFVEAFTSEQFDQFFSLLPPQFLVRESSLQREFMALGKLDACRWALKCRLYQERRDGVHGYTCDLYVLVGKDGVSLWQGLLFAEALIRLCPLPQDRDNQDPAAVNAWLYGKQYPLMVSCLLGVSFLHCKNVTTVEHVPDAPLQKKAVKKHGIPLVTFHTLDIDPMKHVLRTQGGLGTSTGSLQQALHICRGHFATYTAERPLFGRLRGTFWVPQHVRGTARKGVVLKDYSVGLGVESGCATATETGETLADG